MCFIEIGMILVGFWNVTVWRTLLGQIDFEHPSYVVGHMGRSFACTEEDEVEAEVIIVATRSPSLLDRWLLDPVLTLLDP